jgi:hypothetical protein
MEFVMRYFLLIIFLLVGCDARESSDSVTILPSANSSQSDTKTIEELAEELFTLRTDSPPQEWKLEEINRAIPEAYRDRSGEIHILAWAKFQDKSDQDVSERTHLLVLKKFNDKNEKVNRYILAHVIEDAGNNEFPWRLPEPSRVFEGLTTPPATGPNDFSNVLRHAFEEFRELPTDFQVAKFLEASRWGCRPCDSSWGCQRVAVVAVAADGSAGFHNSVTDAKPIQYVSSLVAGGVDREVWKELFGRRVPITCFMPFAENKVAAKK